MKPILEKIYKKQAKAAVIGLGYVGLPTAIEIARSGFFVFGLDVDKQKIDLLRQGNSYIQDVPSQELREVLKIKSSDIGNGSSFFPSDDFNYLSQSDVILICVPTPLDKNKVPDISCIQKASEEIAKHLRPGQLISLESTTYPGTTEELVLPIFENKGLKVGKDFFLAFSPERIDPGNKKYKFYEIPRVVGGITKECTKIAAAFYRNFVKDVFPVSSAKTAEMIKIHENTFRLVNISFVNEIALLCGKMGLDIWEVIEGAKTKPYGFQPFYPGPGVGGHCIALDPAYLTWRAKEYNFSPRFIDLAYDINQQMPHFVVTKIISALNSRGKAMRGSKILVSGVAYKKDLGDSRESAAYEIIPDLIKKGAKVSYHDPLIPEIEIQDSGHLKNNHFLLKSISLNLLNIKKFDCVLILADHSNIDYDWLAKNSKLVVDTRNAIKSRKYKNVFRL